MTQNSSLQPPSQSLSSENFCVNCNSDDHWVLHNVGNRAEQRKLCTSCVLKCHPTSFCPTCFNLHDPNSLSPPPFSTTSASSSSSSNRTLTCLKCSSVSHITCVPPNAPKSPYLCPPCSNPSFKFFDVKKSKKTSDQNGQSDGGNGGPRLKKVQEDGEGHVMDEREAKMFVLAARIAMISMNKAYAAAKADVERRVKDAALARKRAKESIDHVVSVSSKLVGVKQQQRRDAGPGSVYEPIKIERNGVAHNVGGSRGESSLSNGNRAMVAAPQSNGGNANNNHVMKENTGV